LNQSHASVASSWKISCFLANTSSSFDRIPKGCPRILGKHVSADFFGHKRMND
jgi:hypothetical protein